MRRRPWRIVAIATPIWTVGFIASDIIFHQWWFVPFMAVTGAVGTYFARANDRQAQERWRQAHRPDYAKIKRLEKELGLAEPESPAFTLASRSGNPFWAGLLPPPWSESDFGAWGHHWRRTR